jgi:transposase InsO family protein
MQFTDKKFREFLAALGITQHFTSVEHPQTNGQAEAANRVILRRRCPPRNVFKTKNCRST